MGLEIIDGKLIDTDEIAFNKKYTVISHGHEIWYRRFLDGLLFHNEIFDSTNSLLGTDISMEMTRVECSSCGLRVQTRFDKASNTFECEGAECPYPDGHVPLSFDLNFPSGIMVVENDMRRLLNEQPPDDSIEHWSDHTKNFYVNTKLGCVNTSLWYAERGMAHCFVGNTCPGIYRTSEDSYEIGNYWEHDGEEDDEGVNKAPGTEVAGVLTDLWWFSIMDKILYENLGGTFDQWTDMIDVKPGTWTFTHHWHEGDFDQDSSHCYTDITFKG